MFWGQKLKVYTDHKSLVRDVLGLRCDPVYRWRLILEEYDPGIVYIKGTDNNLADTVSCLEYDMDINTCNINVHIGTKALARLFYRTLNNDPF